MLNTEKASQAGLYLIDSTSPFFGKLPKDVINWSKAPHHLMESRGRLKKKRTKQTAKRFTTYLSRVSQLGYNAITFDELAYLVRFPFYPSELKTRLKDYQKHFKKLFRLAEEKNLKVYVTSDLFFFNEAIDAYTEGKTEKILALIEKSVVKLFRTYPNIGGVIFRCGESDGLDVSGDFKSRLFLKKPEMANRFLKKLLPVFEQAQKHLIFRTWTIGAHPLGDLLWNPRTYEKTFNGVDSTSLIISAKYGDGDFFHYLNLCPHFFADDRKKIVELQARREYEGFGEFPSFVGFLYQTIFQALKSCPNLVGIQVWCQTGGWSQFRNRTFLKGTSFWNELNTSVSIYLFKEGLDVETAVKKFIRDFYAGEFFAREIQKLILFLSLSEEVVKELLYDPHFTRHTFYLNRVRLPPLLHIFWDHVTLSDSLRAVLLSLAGENPNAERTAADALERLAKMQQLAKQLKLPYKADFQESLFTLLFAIRRLIYETPTQEKIEDLKQQVEVFEDLFPNTYHFHVQITPDKKYFWLRFLLKLAVRRNPRYRLIDRFLFNPVSASVVLFFLKRSPGQLPAFVGKQAMGLEHFLK
jgi:hypothetical protein